jgi:hypothetical protein
MYLAGFGGGRVTSGRKRVAAVDEGFNDRSVNENMQGRESVGVRVEGQDFDADGNEGLVICSVVIHGKQGVSIVV